MAKNPEGAQPKVLATFGKLGHLRGPDEEDCEVL
jgi:hypothetical protein